MKRFLIAFVIIISGCGMPPPTDDPKAVVPKEPVNEQNSSGSSRTTIEGFLMPWNVRVNGQPQSWASIEDFFTVEYDKIVNAAAANGGYVVDFDETGLGIEDFKAGTSVYVEGQSEHGGVAAETEVKYDGSFSVELPIEGVASVTARTVKRLSYTMKSDHLPVLQRCFLLVGTAHASGHDAATQLIVRDFTTSVTKYRCSSQPTSGLQWPSDGMGGGG